MLKAILMAAMWDWDSPAWVGGVSLGYRYVRRPMQRIKRVASIRRNVTIKSPGGFLMEVDPRTRQTTDRPQQFVRNGDHLVITHDFVDDPEVVDVTGVSYA